MGKGASQSDKDKLLAAVKESAPPTDLVHQLSKAKKVKKRRK